MTMENKTPVDMEKDELYRWVKASERLPERNAEYYVRVGNDYKGVAIFVEGYFYSNDNYINATQWLEKLPPAPVQEDEQN